MLISYLFIRKVKTTLITINQLAINNKYINNRIQHALDYTQLRGQACFRSDFSTIDDMIARRDVITHTKEYDIYMTVGLIDSEKTFNTIYLRAITIFL